MIKFRLLAAVSMSGALVAGAAGVASADYRNDSVYWENGQNKTCYGVDGFRFQLTFNSNQGGAQRFFGYSEGNFGHMGYGGSPQGGTNPAYFCNGGNGAGYPVKNNAAWAGNTSYDYYANVYFNSWWTGALDYVARNYAINLEYTKNENASFKWV